MLKRVLTYVAAFAAGAIAFGVVGSTQGYFGEDPAVAQVSMVEDPPSQMKLAQPSTAPSTEPATSMATSEKPGSITAISDLVRNSRVQIEGVVVRASEEDEFILEDATGSVQVYTGTSFFVAEVGERVRVSGFVDESLLLEVYAQEIVHEDGRVTTIRY